MGLRANNKTRNRRKDHWEDIPPKRLDWEACQSDSNGIKGAWVFMGWRKRDWKRYNHFRKYEVKEAIRDIVEIIAEEKPPYKVREPCTRGRPPANPGAIVMFMFIKELLDKSYRETHAYIIANPSLWREDLFGKLPAPNTVNDHVKEIPERYMDRIIRRQSRRLKKGDVQ